MKKLLFFTSLLLNLALSATLLRVGEQMDRLNSDIVKFQEAHSLLTTVYVNDVPYDIRLDYVPKD